MKIICIGRNYVEHAKEMNAPLPPAPIFFMKPESALLRTRDFFYPKFTKNLHYECEIVLKIDKVGKNIDEKFAHKYYSSCTLGLDFTARDIQQNCKEKGLPWEIAKSFDQSAPLSKIWIPIKNKAEEIKFELEKNVNLVKFEKNRIEISFNDSLDKDFVKDLSTKLFEWTKERWIITLSKSKGDLSIREKKENEKKILIEKAKQTEIYKNFMENFPDAELVDVKSISKEDKDND